MIRLKSRKLALALMASSALTAPALAQQLDLQPPARETMDPNGVDLALGKLTASSPAISIGSGDQGLSWSRSLTVNTAGSGWTNPYRYALFGSAGASIQAVTGNSSVTFNFNSSTGAYDNQQGTGETLTQIGSNWTLTLRDGTVVTLNNSGGYTNFEGGGVVAVAQTITLPNQAKLTFAYALSTNSEGTKTWARIQSVQSSNGYMAKYQYVANGTIRVLGWSQVAKITLLNSAVDYCDPSADSCSFSATWPSLSFTYVGTPEVDTVTDTLNRATKFTFGSGFRSDARRRRRTTSLPSTM